MTTSPTERARARSRLFQLLAWGFGYPIPELVTQMRGGAYAETLAEAHRRAFDRPVELPRCECDAPTCEAQYAELFEVGAKGRPAVSLCSGDHEELLDGRGRPELLLELIRWYSHFGLTLQRDPEQRELPDHLTCQLEFLAWLAHLEAGATPASELARGYRQAQIDFCARSLGPFASRLRERIGREVERRGCDRVFAALADTTRAAVVATLGELEGSLREARS
ncbi:MAG: molecular chaperone TorD family protein [Myxococcota bacterium]|nr:molecular chaperone TorD family protein [Myxococcota bacterium]